MKEGESRVLDNGNLVGKFGFGLKASNYKKPDMTQLKRKGGCASCSFNSEVNLNKEVNKSTD